VADRTLFPPVADRRGRWRGQAVAPAPGILADSVRLADLASAMEAAGPAAPHEQVLGCDLADRAAVDAMVAGCEAIIHLGGVSVERPFEEILEANIKGVFHIYEAARRHGVKRVIFASSNHVTGFYRQDQRIDAHDLKRPDGYYGCPSPMAKTWRSSTSTAMAWRR
jgi:uronate dehydrogenase